MICFIFTSLRNAVIQYEDCTYAHVSSQSLGYSIVSDQTHPTQFTVCASLHTILTHPTSTMIMTQCFSWLKSLSKCHLSAITFLWAISHVVCTMCHTVCGLVKSPTSTFVINLFDALLSQGSESGGGPDYNMLGLTGLWYRMVWKLQSLQWSQFNPFWSFFIYAQHFILFTESCLMTVLN